MAGKVFGSMFGGSLYGVGSVVWFVWFYAITKLDAKGYVELNPRLLAGVIGSPIGDDVTPEAVSKAIAFLCEPDPHSRTSDEEGRRLVQEGHPFRYRVVNAPLYRKLRDDEAVRQHHREDWLRRHPKSDKSD